MEALMGQPQLKPESRYDVGVIVESWRLWESICKVLPVAPKLISVWQLDADYFELQAPDGSRVAFVMAQGASIAVDALERLAGSGAKTVVRIGTTGGLQPNQHIGDVILPLVAVRDEGTSAHYLPEKVPALASTSLVDRLRTALREVVGVDVVPSMTWTTDGRWVESDADILTYSQLGVTAVDMETAAVLAAGLHRRIQVASVSVVADLPIHHVGDAYKGLPPGEAEWNTVVQQSAMVLCAVLRAACDWRFASLPSK
jgi:nucleoside phosphorylase